MKLDKFIKEDNQVEERKVQQEQKVVKVLVNSIDPKPNHKLFEFHPVEDGFRIFQSEWRSPKELVFKNVNGKFVEQKEESKPVFIDIFNPNFIVEKKRHNVDLQEGIAYITALNYDNAVRKFKQLNPQYFN